MGLNEKKEAKLLAGWLAHSISGSYYYYFTQRALEVRRRNYLEVTELAAPVKCLWGVGQED